MADTVLVRLGLALALLAPAAVTQAQNTLLVIADDVGVDAIAAYRESSAPAPTPTLDALAAGGVLFRQCWANPVCSPTRASVLTGRHGFRTGIGNALAPAAPGLDYGEVLLPEVLTAARVGSALVGKWHLGERSGAATPNQHGWPHFAGALGAALPSYTSWPKVVNGVPSTSTTYATTFAVDEALAWIAAHPEPWCVVVAFHAGHAPFHAPPAHLHTQNLAGLNPGTTPRPFFVAMVQAMDRELGRLLATLAPAVRARTNVVFLGDNGTPREVISPPFPADHAKGTLYQGGVRVPLIVSGPAVTGGGREVHAAVGAVDLFATIAELHGIDLRAHVPATTPLDCVGLAPYLRNPSQPPLRAHAYAELFGNGFGAAADRGWTIRDGRYKLVRWTQRTPPAEAFFDLAADPHERVDRIGSLTAAERRSYEDLRAAVARLRGEALALGYGSACPGSVGLPLLAAGGGPRRGAPFPLTASNLAPSVQTALLVLGASRDAFGGLTLPYDLGIVGMHGCQLHASPDVLLPRPASGGAATWSLPVPGTATLLGGSVYFQALVLEPQANAAGTIATAGVLAVIG
jgi:arylsulfatase A-like enzyme